MLLLRRLSLLSNKTNQQAYMLARIQWDSVVHRPHEVPEKEKERKTSFLVDYYRKFNSYPHPK